MNIEPRFIAHAYFHFPERRIVVQDDEGYDETVQFTFDTDGAESFQVITELLQDNLESDQRTYCF